MEKHDSATHAFLFWEGFDEASKRAAGKIFSASPRAKVLVVVTGSFSSTNLEPGMAKLGFGKLTCAEIVTGIQVTSPELPAFLCCPEAHADDSFFLAWHYGL